MNNIIDSIKKHNSVKKLIFLIVISGLAYLLMGTKIFGIYSDFNSNYMLDLTVFYTGNYFINTLSSISTIQIQYYTVLHIIDYIFIISFYPLLVLLLAKVIKSKHQWLIILPLLAMIFDLLENIIIDVHLHVGVTNFLGSLSGVFTLQKFIFIFISIFVFIVYIFKNRRKNEKTNL